MSLEEIEERLNSVVKTETISQLKSTVWKERLEGSNRSCASCFVLYLIWIGRLSFDLRLFTSNMLMLHLTKEIMLYRCLIFCYFCAVFNILCHIWKMESNTTKP